LEQANAFGLHLEDRFTPFDFASTEQKGETQHNLQTPLQMSLQMSLPIKHIRIEEISEVIQLLPKNKAPGIDRICNTTLKALPIRAILYIALIFNAILRVQVFPKQWKLAAILMIHKPGKPENDPESYRPISLLPSLSKLWERLIANRITVIMRQSNILPDHQFGFREGHGTVEQVHRLVKHILQAFDDLEYSNAVFIDMQQAFDKVWYDGLLCKIKNLLPAPYYGLLRSYLEGREFKVTVRDTYSNNYLMRAGVPQGSVLGPLLYSLYTADIPSPNHQHK